MEFELEWSPFQKEWEWSVLGVSGLGYKSRSMAEVVCKRVVRPVEELNVGPVATDAVLELELGVFGGGECRRDLCDRGASRVGESRGVWLFVKDLRDEDVEWRGRRLTGVGGLSSKLENDSSASSFRLTLLLDSDLPLFSRCIGAGRAFGDTRRGFGVDSDRGRGFGVDSERGRDRSLRDRDFVEAVWLDGVRGERAVKAGEGRVFATADKRADRSGEAKSSLWREGGVRSKGAEGRLVRTGVFGTKSLESTDAFEDRLGAVIPGM